MRDYLKNKAGVVQLDLRQVPLRIGQPVLIMDSVGYSNSRGSVSTGHVVGFNRYVILIKGETDQADIDAYVKFFEDKADKRFKCPDWEEIKRRGMENIRTESVSACYLIGCTEYVKQGWDDGSLFEQ